MQRIVSVGLEATIQTVLFCRYFAVEKGTFGFNFYVRGLATFFVFQSKQFAHKVEIQKGTHIVNLVWNPTQGADYGKFNATTYAAV
jgi:hypothetical protein